MSKVRIYGTLGPACSNTNTLEEMLREGMTGIRLNLSHTALDEAGELTEAYLSAADRCGMKPDLLIDMQGPELRIGTLAAPLVLIKGSSISVDSIPFPDSVKEALSHSDTGREILLDDGKLLLSSEQNGMLLVLRGGQLESRKSVTLQGIRINEPAVTEQDRLNLNMAASYGVTGVMQPFVRGRDDLNEVRSAMNAAGLYGARLLAKIENADGVGALDDIIPCCDEVVIARGDLGNSMDLWKLPAVQKRISESCRKAGRDFMVVTQMLDSMIRRSVPTRAEVSDVFNAVLDGAASVMLTGETASGQYPVQAIRYLSKTACEAVRFRDQ